MEQQANSRFDQARRPRGIYERPVGICGFAKAGLHARDLSVGGLRVAPHPALSLGVCLTLELECADGAPPVQVDAEVIRDDGSRGAIFEFTWLDPMERERLSAFIQRFNPVGYSSELDAHDDETPTMSIDLSAVVAS